MNDFSGGSLFGFKTAVTPDLTIQKILNEAKDLISVHGYTNNFIREGEEYSLPAAFDEIVFQDSEGTAIRFLATQAGIWRYPQVYNQAHDCLIVAWGARVPNTQEEALDALNLALFEATENTPEQLREKAGAVLRDAGYLE